MKTDHKRPILSTTFLVMNLLYKNIASAWMLLRGIQFLSPTDAYLVLGQDMEQYNM